MAYKPAELALIRFGGMAQMDIRLARLIADRLALSVAQNGRASLALSGGSTPRGLYEQLSHEPINWAKVDVTLVDERFVPPDHEASNEKLVRETLLQNQAAAANFMGLKGTAQTPQGAAMIANKALGAMGLPFDAVVLGMGEDGHTASWFSGAEELGGVLDPQNPVLCAPLNAPPSPITGPYTSRLTLTLSALKEARLCVLALKETGKKEAYEKALQPGPVKDMPIRAIMRMPLGAFWPCWTP
ncbi:MAG: 6-phosphogluconolactonase [Robiginitomaculum sp.]|nr:6-phosphogluconolactonase [Robiginitomaculum sp.]MDQ7077044.1 6-phosphogluconolactonase [Robiginitomaculum sp.]